MSDTPRSGVRKKAKRRLSLEESVVVMPAQDAAPAERSTSTALRTPDPLERQSPMPGVPEPIVPEQAASTQAAIDIRAGR